MPVRSLLRVFLAVLWLWPAVAYGQSPALMDAYKRAKELYAQGRYQEALPFARNALRLSEQEFGRDHPKTATRLNNLARLYRRQGKYAEAEPLFKRALAIREEALGPEHPRVATILNNLALIDDATGRHGAADIVFLAVGKFFAAALQVFVRLFDLLEPLIREPRGILLLLNPLDLPLRPLGSSFKLVPPAGRNRTRQQNRNHDRNRTGLHDRPLIKPPRRRKFRISRSETSFFSISSTSAYAASFPA
ncbi:MAG: tetratricopeptide repeat protein, partial [Proteobacteria bacterium]|nr:tetratricopeptide repeat protein [Pseudomonadota bacterium]